jgi:hypothetical protein
LISLLATSQGDERPHYRDFVIGARICLQLLQLQEIPERLNDGSRGLYVSQATATTEAEVSRGTIKRTYGNYHSHSSTFEVSCSL